MKIKLINARSYKKRLLLMVMRTFIFLLCTTIRGFRGYFIKEETKTIFDKALQNLIEKMQVIWLQ